MSIIDQERYFTSLPREYYRTEEIYQQELENVWFKQWVYVGHVSQIPKKGDYLTYEVGNESVMVVRGDEGAVHANRNTCRHRGLRLCVEDSGSVGRRIVCPYHSWTYGLDGNLLNATRQPDGEFFDYKDFGLVNVHVDVWQGWIFVCLAETAPAPVATMIDAESTASMERLDPLRLKVAHEIVYEVEADWKLLLENGVECYHCPSVHPEFCVALDAGGMSDYYDQDMIPEVVQGLVLPVKEGLESLTMDGGYVSHKLLGEFGRGVPVPNAFGAGWMTQPGYAWAGFHPDYGMVANCLPAGPGRSKMIAQWFVHEDAVEGEDYDVDNLVKLWDITNRQDVHIQERQQLGLNSSTYTPGPNSYTQEPGIHASLRLYLQMMGQAS